MVVELINTGSELLLGRILNTHQQWLCRRLADLGYVVTRQVAVPDTAEAIRQSVREALTRADLILTTGGLGPTSDDITRELIAGLLGKKLREDAVTVAVIKSFFHERRRPMPEGNLVQAMVPEGALVLANPRGTAPGLAMEVGGGAGKEEDGEWKIENGKAPVCPLSSAEGREGRGEEASLLRAKIPSPQPSPRAGGERETEPELAALHTTPTPSKKWLIMLPGPPRELRPMFTETVVPLLQRVLPVKNKFVCRTLRTAGVGESGAQEKIAGPLAALMRSGLELGYCAHIGQVDVRLSARGNDAERMVRAGAEIVCAQFGPTIFGEGDDELEAVVIRLLTERKQTLAVAESCSGGGIADRLTNVPGASAVFLGGYITYSNALKEKFLGVQSSTLAEYGAVSEPVAREMAEGARRATTADYAIAVTGIAGPAGGTAEKPVGTVFIALAAADGTEVWKLFNPWDRVTFKEATARQAINQLRLRLLK